MPLDMDLRLPARTQLRFRNEVSRSVNLLIKLDTTNPDIALSKTIRAQFNIGSNQLSEFIIESGGAQ